MILDSPIAFRFKTPTHVLVFNLLVVFSLPGCTSSDRQSKDAGGPPPEDLQIEVVAGSRLPGQESHITKIYADGTGRYSVSRTDQPAPPLEEHSFVLEDGEIDLIWSEISDSKFFQLEDRYVDESIEDGYYLVLTITANRRTHTVEMENISVPTLEQLLLILTDLLPRGAMPRVEPASADG